MSTSPRTDANRAPLAASRSGSGTPTDGSFSAGRPGKRSRYANLRANPKLTLHAKRGADGDVEMTARPITDTGERREVLSRIASPNALDAWIEGSPLVELNEVSRVRLPVATLSGTTSSTPDSAAAVSGRGMPSANATAPRAAATSVLDGGGVVRLSRRSRPGDCHLCPIECAGSNPGVQLSSPLNVNAGWWTAAASW